MIALLGFFYMMASPLFAQTAPPSPPFYVLDEMHVLSPAAKSALENILVSEAHVAGEKIEVAILAASNGNAEDTATEIFTEWQLDRRPRSALLVVIPDQHAAVIKTGFGLEDSFPREKSDTI